MLIYLLVPILILPLLEFPLPFISLHLAPAPTGQDDWYMRLRVE